MPCGVLLISEALREILALVRDIRAGFVQQPFYCGLVGRRQSEGHWSLRAVEKHWNPFLFILSEAAILLPGAGLPNPP